MNGSSSVLAPAGAPAHALAELSWVLIGGAAAVFAIVIGLLAWVVLRRRGRAGTGSRRWIVGGGLLFPGAVLLALFAYAELGIRARMPARAADELVVSVTGRQWWWQLRYRDPASGREVAVANEIHLPAGRTVVFGLNSGDVIHSFWVPSLAGKVDMIPGRVQQLRVRADEPGVHLGPCAEFCGDQHARMALHVVVDGPADFDRWLAAQAAPAAPPSGPLARRGLDVFAERRCAACHALRGLFPDSDAADAGPDLTHVGSRRFIGAGTLRADAAGFATWVASVQHVKPGARMPSYGDSIDAESLAALAAFLEQLQ